MNITLLDGRSTDTGSIRWDKSSYHFYLGSEDVTNLINRADKVANWSGFDVYKDNSRLSAEQPATRQNQGLPPLTLGPVEDLPTGAGYIAGETLVGTASDLARGAGSYIQTTTNTLVIFGVAGLVAYLLLSKK